MRSFVRSFIRSFTWSGKWFLPLLASSLSFAAPADRITAPIDSSQMVALTGNVHGLAQARYDLGRADGGKVLYGVTLAFQPSAAQQAALNTLLAQQQQRSSPNYHKWLTPSQFADRFGMTQNDIDRVSAWLQAQGFTVTSVANSRNQISFDGTVAQIESVFHTEIHDYLVDGEIHFANATNPSVPAALAGSVLGMGHLHNFNPKPRAKVRSMSSDQANPHFTSAISGNHFLAPGDFATIYQIQPLYAAGIDGTGQSIVVVGQSSVLASDLSNFRSAAGLAAKTPQYILYPSNSISTRCSGDEGESDLDLEWSGGVAQNANIIFVYAGLLAGEVCGNNRTYSVWDALYQAVDNNYAPVISTSYGYCESGLGSTFAGTVRGWAQQANSQGQTIVAASGDAGAADCDGQGSTEGTLGLSVDVPAAIPEVTGMGGNEFTGDTTECPGSPATCTGTPPNAPADTPYWSGTTGGNDTISSALEYIPETAWNDTSEGDGLAASGGGASIYFTKAVGEASWQTGTGVPSGNERDVPDLSFNASPFHDPYLICSEDYNASSCSSGFRTGSGGDLTVVGGTSCAAPTFAAVVALLNQYLVKNGFQPTAGIGNPNPNLYYIAANNPTALNDVTTGNNIVPCEEASPDCPTISPFQYGFSAGVGYDQVTGLGSVNANTLATAWGELSTATTTAVLASSNSINSGNSVTFTATVTPSSATGNVSFYDNGSTAALGSGTLSGGTATFTTSALPTGSNSIVGTYNGINAASSSSAVVVNVAAPYTMSPSPASLTVSAGQQTATTITIAPVNGFNGTVTFTNSTSSSPGSCTTGLPAGALCSFSQSGSVTPPGSMVLTITTAANMAIPSGAQTITISGTSGSTVVTTTISLTVSATNQAFTLSSMNGVDFPVAVGGSAGVNITVGGSGSPVNFVTNSATALPLTYSCVGTPPLTTAEISCTLPNNGQPTTAATVTVTLVTTPVTTQLLPPLGGSHMFYALLFPGLFGVVFVAGSRARGARLLGRLLGMIVVLACCTLGLGSCGGSSNNNNNSLNNPGTPAGTYAVSINATTGGTNPLTFSLPITLKVQ